MQTPVYRIGQRSLLFIVSRSKSIIRNLQKMRGGGFGSVDSAEGINLRDYFEQVTRTYDPLTNPFWYYTHLVDGLLGIENVRIAPVSDLLSISAGNERGVSLRHDVDADPLTALRCARFLASRGVPGSFYLLHTAPYYGQFVKNTLVRNPYLSDWVTAFLVTGCELGLHNDCLNIYLNHGLDGAQALLQEISWLRSRGANIRGTVAHNSGPAYGAENFEIFSGRVLWRRTLKTPQGKTIPLGLLSEKELGLSYEGTYAMAKQGVDTREASRFFADRQSSSLRSKTWMERYLVNNPAQDYLVDYEFWLMGPNQWAIAGKWNWAPVFEWMVGLEQVLAFARGLPPGSRSMFVIHPEYVRGHSSESDRPPC